MAMNYKRLFLGSQESAVSKMVDSAINEPKLLIKDTDNKDLQDEYCIQYDQTSQDYNKAVDMFWGRLTKMIIGIVGERTSLKKLIG
jgi:hypothetical protein